MIADKLRARTGKTWTYHWVQKSGSSSGEGECVMTHLDIDATDDYLLSVSRSVAMARLNVNGRIVNVFSTHLDHQASSTRLTQVKQLVAWADHAVGAADHRRRFQRLAGNRRNQRDAQDSRRWLGRPPRARA